MLFNSYVFIFAFLPVTTVVYFLLNRFRYTVAAKVWLAAASLFFYSWWNIAYLPLILASIAFNFCIGRLLQIKTADIAPNLPADSRTSAADAAKAETAAASALPSPSSRLNRKAVLIFGIVCNLLLLGYYKYADFLIANINGLTGASLPLLKLVLPLGISFFTFTQIAYLVDAYKAKAQEYNFINYVLFVTFYPHLIAGPILHHSEMMPQFDRLRNKIFQFSNVTRGLFVFSIGLFKKVVIADTFAIYANYGFDQAQYFVESWLTSLSYTLQLYFDFSGYTDMAIGAALFFNIRLPDNFNSPYKALSIQDFWRRWHMTLSRFLLNYIYIPLGGNRKGLPRTLTNLMLTFIIGGLWHGAGWTFLFWGFLHGAALIVHRLWQKVGKPLPKWLAWFITFQFVNVAWVFFRAGDWDDAIRILKGMIGLQGFALTRMDFYPQCALLVVVFMLIALFAKNSGERMAAFRPGWRTAAFMAVAFIVSLLYFNKISEFLYFNF